MHIYGLGTIINTVLIIAGGFCGMLFGRLLKERIQQTLQLACGICVLFIGMAGALSKMFTVGDNGIIISGHSMLITICIALGSFLGELINIEKGFNNFGEWLKIKTKSQGDGGFVDAFVTSSLTVSIGAMAIMGSIQDGIYGDYSILVSKGILDFIIIMVMTCSMGKGSIFSAIPVFVLEGAMTALAILIKPLFTDLALDYLSLCGSILIFCVGINLVFDRRIRVANMLPSLIFAVAAAFIPWAATL